MALVKYSGIITEIRGNLGGSNFSQGPVGPTIRALGKRKRRKCYEAAIAAGEDPWDAAHECAQLATVAGTWGAVPATGQASWNTLAQNITWYNRFGDPFTPNGYQVFMKFNLNLFGSRGTQLVNAPGLQIAPNGYALEIITAVDLSPIIKVNVLGNLDEYYIVTTVSNQYPGVRLPPFGSPNMLSQRVLKRNGHQLVSFEPAIGNLEFPMRQWWLARYKSFPVGYSTNFMIHFVNKISGESFVGASYIHEWQ